MFMESKLKKEKIVFQIEIEIGISIDTEAWRFLKKALIIVIIGFIDLIFCRNHYNSF